ncbi:MAG TPA: 3-hydroxyacyl-ACP dehydratase FabZ [Thermodesulfobacteriota bacterium]|nr:3-hydroxyacyl-ACP dehydratase FabZ [Thermodesulfobacteriota bacterium]
MMMDSEEVKALLPHREPFLFIDRVIELQPGVRIVAVRKFHPGEGFFRGHFPGNPIVPGVIIVEALAQAGGILVYSSYTEELKGKTPALVGLENVRFKKPVLPGDEVSLDVQISRGRSRIWKLKGEAFVGEAKVAEAEILASVF